MDMLLPTCVAWARWKLPVQKEHCTQSRGLSSEQRIYYSLLRKWVRLSSFLSLFISLKQNQTLPQFRNTSIPTLFLKESMNSRGKKKQNQTKRQQNQKYPPHFLKKKKTQGKNREFEASMFSVLGEFHVSLDSLGFPWKRKVRNQEEN